MTDDSKISKYAEGEIKRLTTFNFNSGGCIPLILPFYCKKCRFFNRMEAISCKECGHKW